MRSRRPASRSARPRSCRLRSRSWTAASLSLSPCIPRPWNLSRCGGSTTPRWQVPWSCIRPFPPMSHRYGYSGFRLLQALPPRVLHARSCSTCRRSSHHWRRMRTCNLCSYSCPSHCSLRSVHLRCNACWRTSQRLLSSRRSACSLRRSGCGSGSRSSGADMSPPRPRICSLSSDPAAGSRSS